MRVRRRNPDRTDELPGPLTVAEVLERLDVNPHTVLVIHDGELVTASTELDDDAEVEIRPVISGGAGGPTCAECGAPAAIEEPRHRAAWCPAHFTDHVHGQVRKAIDATDYVIHGWRYNAAVALAEAGCSDAEIMAVTGHKTLAMVAKYRAQANQRKLSKQAQERRR